MKDYAEETINQIKLKVGSSNKGGKGYVQNQKGGNGESSTGKLL